jgi:uncharacterized protein YndB with AHSA1/START domain
MIMTPANTASAPPVVRFERRYRDATVQDLWELWTTKEGFESWWGPQGFRVEVHSLDLRAGGELVYDMIASAPEQIEFMKKAGMALSHATRAAFGEIAPLRHLELKHVIDFAPGIKPYEHRMRVEFSGDRHGAGMVITVEPHSTPEWTQRATMGMESQLTKVPGVLAARTQRR